MTLPSIPRAIFAGGCAFGMALVAIAAAGAHLGPPDPELRRAFDAALLMHAAHVPAILAAALLARPLASLAGGVFALGVAMFSGSIYLHGMGVLWVPLVTMFGGFALLLGWAVLLAAGLRASKP